MPFFIILLRKTSIFDFTMKNQVFTSNKPFQISSYIWYTELPDSKGIAIDPGQNWDDIHAFLKKNKIELKYILLTQVNFETAAWISHIKGETSAHFLSFQSDLLKLRMLPRWADEKNVCGIKIPQVDQFLDGRQTFDFQGFEIKIATKDNHHEYQVGKLRVPEK